MNTQIALTSDQLLLLMIALVLLVLIIIIGGRMAMARRTKHKLAEKGSASDDKPGTRSKYPEVDIFRYTGIFRSVGIVVALASVLFMVNWTTFAEDIFIPDDALVLEEEIAVEPPRTAAPPPPPPPPPPPVIEEVPNELILEEDDDLAFMDQSIDAESVVEITETVAEPVNDAPPPPPPPPPPPIEEYEEIFKIVEEMPRFPGCEDLAVGSTEKKKCADEKLLEFIYSNIQYPLVARENNVQGSVVVTFVVNRDGSIEQIEVLRDVGAGCGEEAVRVIELMRTEGIQWIPGKQRGMPVRVQFMLPVKFKLLS